MALQDGTAHTVPSVAPPKLNDTEEDMRNRYIDAELKLAQLLGWTSVDQVLQKLRIAAYAYGFARGANERTAIPAWARSNGDCTTLMLAHDCYVTLEQSPAGEDVMVATWMASVGFPARLTVRVADHQNKACAYRYAAVLAITTQLESIGEEFLVTEGAWSELLEAAPAG